MPFLPQQWEYHHQKLTSLDQLNELGERGWELVVHIRETDVFVFKRRKITQIPLHADDFIPIKHNPFPETESDESGHNFNGVIVVKADSEAAEYIKKINNQLRRVGRK